MVRALKVVGVILGLALVVTVAAGWIFRDYVTAYLNYQSAPENVKALEAQAKFSQEGKRFYYGAAPRIEHKEAVQKACASVASEGLLGCYDGRRIYLLDITDTQFESEEPVTAAHEMLHAAYDKLTPDERKRVEGLVEAELDKRKDPELNERIAKYDDRASQLDEAFTIFGSETPDSALSSELVEVYQEYFTDRAAVVALHQQFESQFDQLEGRVNELKAALDARKRALDRDLGSGNVALYNSQVDGYNELVEQHNSLVNQFNELGQRFNRAISQ